MWAGTVFWTLASILACACAVGVHGEVGGGGSVSGAQEDMPPEAGAISLRGDGRHIVLKVGTYHGDLVVHGNGNLVEGAGVGQTIVDGRLDVAGNGNRLTGITVTQPSQVLGDGNAVGAVQFSGGVTVSGNGNSQ